MKCSGIVGKRIRWSGVRRLILGGMALLALSLAGTPARAGEGELSEESAACQKCHDKRGEEKLLDDGEKLSLHVSTKAFLASMHGETDCEDCHADLDAKTHGKEKAEIASKREYSLSLQETCRECHKKRFKEFEDSVHSALVKEGSKKAPICSDCHSPHTLLSVKIAAPIEQTPCAKCHKDIFKAYAKDVHGLERVAKGKTAPLCADCHQTHDVKAASLGEGRIGACLVCHKNAVAEHQDWLPNTERHFEAISCPACHVPGAQRRVNLRLYDSVTRHQVSEKSGVPQFKQRASAADSNDLGLDERALWSLLKEFNQDDAANKTTLRGRLEVRSGVEAHQISEKSQAIHDCDTCHKEGAEPFQSVTLTIAGPDGRPLRHGVQKEVLNSLIAMESVRGFYAIGGTRIKQLDTLLVLVLLVSVGGPLAHLTIKWLSRGMRRRHAADSQAASQTPDGAGAKSPD